jgi:hypothetical protein
VSLLIRAGFMLGILAVALHILGTLVKFDDFDFVMGGRPGQTVARFEFSRFIPLSERLNTAVALYGTVAVLLVVCAAGLLGKHHARWGVAFAAVAGMWAVRMIGERLSAYFLDLWGHGPGWWLMGIAPLVAVGGALVVLVAARLMGKGNGGPLTDRRG